MNCRRVMNLMSAYIDGELTGTEMLAIRRHLSECAECSEEHESTLMVKRALGRLRAVAPEHDIATAILGKLDETRVPGYQRALNSITAVLHRKLSPVAAAMAASGLALVILSAGGVQTPEDGSQMAYNHSASIQEVSTLPDVPGARVSGGPVAIVDSPFYESSSASLQFASLNQ